MKTPFFVLDNDLLVGIKQIDQEHQILINLINELYEFMSQGKGKEIIEKTIADLINYTEFHFKSEEKLLSDYGYPEFRSHLLKHYMLVKEVKEMQENYRSGRLLVIPKVSDFLKEWLTQHIRISDKHYAIFLKAKGVE